MESCQYIDVTEIARRLDEPFQHPTYQWARQAFRSYFLPYVNVWLLFIFIDTYVLKGTGFLNRWLLAVFHAIKSPTCYSRGVPACLITSLSPKARTGHAHSMRPSKKYAD